MVDFDRGSPSRADGGTDTDSGADADEASEQLAAIDRPAVSPDSYAFDNVPLAPVRPGTALLAVSPAAVDVASRAMLAAGNPEEGIVGVAARSSPRRFLHSLDEFADPSLVQPHTGYSAVWGRGRRASVRSPRYTSDRFPRRPTSRASRCGSATSRTTSSTSYRATAPIPGSPPGCGRVWTP